MLDVEARPGARHQARELDKEKLAVEARQQPGTWAGEDQKEKQQKQDQQDHEESSSR